MSLSSLLFTLFVLLLCSPLVLHARRSGTHLPSKVDDHRSSRMSAARPLPTAPQLNWSRKDSSVLIHFNMATYIDPSYDGCNSNPNLVPSITLFTPKLLNTDQWMEAILAMGATSAVLVAKHNCGFTLWPTKAVVPSSKQPYTYSVANAPVTFDVVGNFINSCKKYGVKCGFYYSVNVNNYLHVANSQVLPPPLPVGAINVTQADFENIVIQQLTELWTNYGDLHEIWFDGGFSSALQARLTSLLNATQPYAVAFNGLGISPNPIRWVGTEMGSAPDPNWSTGDGDGGGDPNSAQWNPAECDTTLQEDDRWFWAENYPLRPFNELVDVFHQTVGRNCMLMMDLAPNRDGLVDPRHMARYKQLGDFVRSCYGRPLAGRNASGSGTSFTVQYDMPTVVDRTVVQEDQSIGQVIRKYTVSALLAEDCSSGSAGTWVQVANGQSVGNKWINLFSNALTVSAIKLDIQTATTVPLVAAFAGYLCDNLPASASSSLSIA